jgi:hypothetical protein
MKSETFKVKHSLQLENSFGVLDSEDNIELEVTVGIRKDGGGWFEFADIKSGGNEWYAEGSLEIEGKEVLGYDGVFSLPSFVIDKLKEWGYDVSEVE